MGDPPARRRRRRAEARARSCVACACERANTREEPGIAIEIRQTKRAIVYRAVVERGGHGTEKVIKTFRTKAAAEAWEREMVEAEARAGLAAQSSGETA